MNENLPTASDYLKHLAQKAPEIVDVKVPSGFVFKFKKPNTLGIVMSGDLPQAATDAAAEAWAEQGVRVPAPTDGGTDNELEVAKKMLDVRNRVLELSYAPKIVLGRATNANELSQADIPNEDLGFLFRWVSAGGDSAVMLKMFPQEPAKSSVARTNSKR